MVANTARKNRKNRVPMRDVPEIKESKSIRHRVPTPYPSTREHIPSSTSTELSSDQSSLSLNPGKYSSLIHYVSPSLPPPVVYESLYEDSLQSQESDNIKIVQIGLYFVHLEKVPDNFFEDESSDLDSDKSIDSLNSTLGTEKSIDSRLHCNFVPLHERFVTYFIGVSIASTVHYDNSIGSLYDENGNDLFDQDKTLDEHETSVEYEDFEESLYSEEDEEEEETFSVMSDDSISISDLSTDDFDDTLPRPEKFSRSKEIGKNTRKVARPNTVIGFPVYSADNEEIENDSSTSITDETNSLSDDCPTEDSDNSITFDDALAFYEAAVNLLREFGIGSDPQSMVSQENIVPISADQGVENQQQTDNQQEPDRRGCLERCAIM